MRWSRRRIRYGVSSLIKGQEERYAADEREMLRQKRYEDANYYKGAKDAMKQLGIKLEGYHFDAR